jgi:hypothetical protein
MKFIIEPHVGVGALKLGMARSEVRATLQPQVVENTVKSTSKIPMDAFYDACVQVFYDDYEICEAIELYSPIRTLFAGMSVFETSYEVLRALVSKMDEHIAEKPDGFTSIDCGLSVYAPMRSEQPELPPESIIVFKRGYYS